MQLPYTKNCFVCGAHNPHGLGLRFRQVGDEVHSDFTPAAHHAGFRDIVHGGILSTALDEAMFWAAACRMKRFCLAAELYVRFIRKVAVGQKMLLVARFEIDRRRIWESSAELRDAAGNVYVGASCKQMPVDGPFMQHAAGDFLPDPVTDAALKLFTDAVRPAR
ncbi:MAG: PaaI family thioesterase [Verrucomicrobiota bacterium]|jgi:acyl-coenzyme A thioesterase PaaI-like protein